MQTAQEFVIDPNDPPTFEKVWRMFQETDPFDSTDYWLGRRRAEGKKKISPDRPESAIE
jgi:hypothetical protein